MVNWILSWRCSKMRNRKSTKKREKERRQNMENQSMAEFYPGAEVDSDCFVLSLLSEEIQDDQVCVITESLQLQKALLASLRVSDSDDAAVDVNSEVDAAVDVNSAGISSSKTALLTDHHSADKEENCSYLEKALMTSLIIKDSDDTAGDVIAAGISSSKTALTTDHSAAKEENRSLPEKDLLTSFIIIDSEDTDTSVDNNTAGKSSPETATLPDDSDFAAGDDDYPFLIIEVCDLCATPEVEDRLIRVSGCRHSFCQQCFERYASSSGKIDSGNCLIKCPTEKCYYQIESDYCVAVLLQLALDKSKY